MSYMLLGGPLAILTAHQHFMCNIANHFLQSRRSSSQAYTNIRKLLDRETELEFSLKPQWNGTHRTTTALIARKNSDSDRPRSDSFLLQRQILPVPWPVSRSYRQWASFICSAFSVTQNVVRI